MPKITKQNFLQNKFSKNYTKQILRILNNFVDSNTTRSELSIIFINKKYKVSLLTDEAADDYLWVVCDNPAYFIQYQIDSVAIIKVNHFIVIVWKPKYIEYPQMIKFPDLKENKSNFYQLQ